MQKVSKWTLFSWCHIHNLYQHHRVIVSGIRHCSGIVLTLVLTQGFLSSRFYILLNIAKVSGLEGYCATLLNFHCCSCCQHITYACSAIYWSDLLVWSCPSINSHLQPRWFTISYTVAVQHCQQNAMLQEVGIPVSLVCFCFYENLRGQMGKHKGFFEVVPRGIIGLSEWALLFL